LKIGHCGFARIAYPCSCKSEANCISERLNNVTNTTLLNGCETLLLSTVEHLELSSKKSLLSKRAVDSLSMITQSRRV